MSAITAESEFRTRILRAVAVLSIQGLPITLPNLRVSGATGGNQRIMQTAAELVREGLISRDHWNIGRDLRTAIGQAEVPDRAMPVTMVIVSEHMKPLTTR